MILVLFGLIGIGMLFDYIYKDNDDDFSGFA